MDVLMQNAEGGEPLGSARLSVATEDLMVSECRLEPGRQPGDPHYHANHSDSFYVLEGELEFVIDGEAVRPPPGTLLVAPRGAIHAFPVAIGVTARFLNLHTPGGFERHLREMVAMRERGETPTAEFMAAHDMHVV